MSSALARRGTILAQKRTPAALAYAAAMKRPAKAKRPSAPPVGHSWRIVDSLTIALPIPPSVNGMYANVPGRGRRKSAAYSAWRDAAGWIVKDNKPGRIVGPYTLALYLPGAMRGDLDNRLKGISDLLVSLGVTDDDRFCKGTSAEKSSAIPTGSCLVCIRIAGGSA